LSQLQTIWLGYNQIEKILAGTFNGLSQLKEIRLDSNQIKEISAGTFNGLSQLQTIRLNNNQIKEIQKEIFGDSPFIFNNWDAFKKEVLGNQK
jgi:Leucine-rich repeat (LRR) protein